MVMQQQRKQKCASAHSGMRVNLLGSLNDLDCKELAPDHGDGDLPGATLNVCDQNCIDFERFWNQKRKAKPYRQHWLLWPIDYEAEDHQHQLSLIDARTSLDARALLDARVLLKEDL